MKKFIVFLCLFCFQIPNSLHGQGAYVQADAALAYDFLNEGNYDLALKELLRVHFYDRSGKEVRVLSDISYCFEQLGDFPNAIKYQSKYLRQQDLSDAERLSASYRKVQLRLSSNPQLALAELYQLNSTFIKADPDRYHYYEAMIHYRNNNTDLCQNALAKLSYSNAVNQEAYNKLQEEIYSNANKKHNHARFLSTVIPGLGQAVNGDVQDGFNSAIINGAMIALFFYVTGNLSFGDAVISVLPWFGRFYVGGMQNAKNASRNKQKRKKEQLLEQLNTLLMNAKASATYN